jgi:hypothetical protein
VKSDRLLPSFGCDIAPQIDQADSFDETSFQHDRVKIAPILCAENPAVESGERQMRLNTVDETGFREAAECLTRSQGDRRLAFKGANLNDHVI